jgi:hypothetical protein
MPLAPHGALNPLDNGRDPNRIGRFLRMNPVSGFQANNLSKVDQGCFLGRCNLLDG